MLLLKWNPFVTPDFAGVQPSVFEKLRWIPTRPGMTRPEPLPSTVHHTLPLPPRNGTTRRKFFWKIPAPLWAGGVNPAGKS